jgi:signal transduction histidine kinase
LSDNGRGIAPQHLERVFQIYQRLCPDVPGHGIGLAVSQQIVQRHGGVMWAESEIAIGTTICFTLHST